MKTVELVKKCNDSTYPIKQIGEFNIYSEYFLVQEGREGVDILRNIEGKLYLISLTNFCVTEWKRPFEEITDVFKVFCIPEYTGGCDGISCDMGESREARKELLKFLINKYM